MLSRDLTAGEFQAMTGMTAEELRLYAERGIVAPSSVDPVSGDRLYARGHLRRGATVDLLRRARVPLSELDAVADFPFERNRERVRARRRVEDLYLDAAEKVAAFEPGDLTAHSTLVPPVEWVGIAIDFDLPGDVDDDDFEGGIETFGRLFVQVSAIEETFLAELAALGAPGSEVSWTTTVTTAVGNGCEQMVLARPGPTELVEAFRARIAERVHTDTGRRVTVVSGTLPRRVEITFSDAVGEPTAADDVAVGYLQVLAFADHVARYRRTAIRPTAREVTHASRSFAGDNLGRPVSVFDVHPEASDEPASPRR